MKHILLLACLLPFVVFAQEEQAEESSPIFSAKPEFYLYVHNQNNFGNNFLSEANEPQFLGFGLQVNVLSAYNFKLGLGGEFIQYDVTNVALAGNIDQSFYHAIYMKLQYELDFGNKWAVEPLIGIGKTRIQQKNDDKDLDRFYGTSLYLGSNILYKITNHVAVYLGANYNFTKFDIKTARNYEDFFQKANQIQLQFGFIFSVGAN